MYHLLLIRPDLYSFCAISSTSCLNDSRADSISPRVKKFSTTVKPCESSNKLVSTYVLIHLVPRNPTSRKMLNVWLCVFYYEAFHYESAFILFRIRIMITSLGEGRELVYMILFICMFTLHTLLFCLPGVANSDCGTLWTFRLICCKELCLASIIYVFIPDSRNLEKLIGRAIYNRIN